jgi:uncharacterized membrane protein YhaH (DUF805 family)
MLGVLIPLLTVGVRRLHELNRTGWWISLPFIPVVGSIVLFAFYVEKATDGPNEFGNDPKGIGSVVQEF